MRHIPDYEELKSLSISEILHLDWGQTSFQELKPDFEIFYNMILRIGEILSNVEGIPPILVNRGETYIINFANIIQALKIFRYNVNSPDSLKERNELLARVKQVIKDYLTSDIGKDPYSQNFLSIYNAILSFVPYDNSNIVDLSNKIQIFKQQLEEIAIPLESKQTELNNAQERFNALLQELEQKAKEKTTEDYADVFKNAAKFNRESSNIWLIGSFVAIVSFCFFIIYENQIITIDTSKGATVITLEYLRRLLIISFFIYIITFLIKQYSIKKHLETLNTHRQNTLNSYNLFLRSIGSADQDVKNALMVEVARAIYESGQTGYINSKDDGNNAPSIMEVTKFIKPNA